VGRTGINFNLLSEIIEFFFGFNLTVKMTFSRIQIIICKCLRDMLSVVRLSVIK